MASKVFIVRASAGYINMFRRMGFEMAVNVMDAAFVVFTGGEDVSPYLYGEAEHPKTYSSAERDEFEKKIFMHCKNEGIPMVGICRGGQFLNVMNGGKMYQDVSGHCGSHYMTDVASGEDVYVSSTHHQMMRPGEGAELIAIASQGGTKEYMDKGFKVKVEDSEPDVEVLFYPDTDSLCFQPHPEFHTHKGDGFEAMHDYFFKLIAENFYTKAEAVCAESCQ